MRILSIILTQKKIFFIFMSIEIRYKDSPPKNQPISNLEQEENHVRKVLYRCVKFVTDFGQVVIKEMGTADKLYVNIRENCDSICTILTQAQDQRFPLSQEQLIKFQKTIREVAAKLESIPADQRKKEYQDAKNSANMCHQQLKVVTRLFADARPFSEYEGRLNAHRERLFQFAYGHQTQHKKSELLKEARSQKEMFQKTIATSKEELLFLKWESSGLHDEITLLEQERLEELKKHCCRSVQLAQRYLREGTLKSPHFAQVTLPAVNMLIDNDELFFSLLGDGADHVSLELNLQLLDALKLRLEKYQKSPDPKVNLERLLEIKKRLEMNAQIRSFANAVTTACRYYSWDSSHYMYTTPWKLWIESRWEDPSMKIWRKPLSSGQNTFVFECRPSDAPQTDLSWELVCFATVLSYVPSMLGHLPRTDEPSEVATQFYEALDQLLGFYRLQEGKKVLSSIFQFKDNNPDKIFDLVTNKPVPGISFDPKDIAIAREHLAQKVWAPEQLNDLIYSNKADLCFTHFIGALLAFITISRQEKTTDLKELRVAIERLGKFLRNWGIIDAIKKQDPLPEITKGLVLDRDILDAMRKQGRSLENPRDFVEVFERSESGGVLLQECVVITIRNRQYLLPHLRSTTIVSNDTLLESFCSRPTATTESFSTYFSLLRSFKKQTTERPITFLSSLLDSVEYNAPGMLEVPALQAAVYGPEKISVSIPRVVETDINRTYLYYRPSLDRLSTDPSISLYERKPYLAGINITPKCYQKFEKPAIKAQQAFKTVLDAFVYKNELATNLLKICTQGTVGGQTTEAMGTFGNYNIGLFLASCGVRFDIFKRGWSPEHLIIKGTCLYAVYNLNDGNEPRKCYALIRTERAIKIRADNLEHGIANVSDGAKIVDSMWVEEVVENEHSEGLKVPDNSELVVTAELPTPVTELDDLKSDT